MNQNRKAFLSAIAKAEGTYGRETMGTTYLSADCLVELEGQ